MWAVYSFDPESDGFIHRLIMVSIIKTLYIKKSRHKKLSSNKRLSNS